MRFCLAIKDSPISLSAPFFFFFNRELYDTAFVAANIWKDLARLAWTNHPVCLGQTTDWRDANKFVASKISLRCNGFDRSWGRFLRNKEELRLIEKARERISKLQYVGLQSKSQNCQGHQQSAFAHLIFTILASVHADWRKRRVGRSCQRFAQTLVWSTLLLLAVVTPPLYESFFVKCLLLRSSTISRCNCFRAPAQ